MDQSAAASLSCVHSMAQCERLLPLPAQHLSRAGGLCRSPARCGATSSSTAAMEFAWRPPTAPERPWTAFPPTSWRSPGCSRRASASALHVLLPDARHARVPKLQVRTDRASTFRGCFVACRRSFLFLPFLSLQMMQQLRDPGKISPAATLHCHPLFVKSCYCLHWNS